MGGVIALLLGFWLLPEPWGASVWPLTAMAGAWLEGHPLTLLGNVAIGPFLATAHDLGQSIATLHTWLGDAILWVAGLHAVAGLYHHFILKDRVLLSMLPERRP